MRRRKSNRNSDKNKLYRGILLVIIGIFLIIWTLSNNNSIGNSNNENIEFCYESCKNICESKKTNLMSYFSKEGGCQCECDDKTKVIFGLDHMNN